ncbi:glycosyltransferase family 4 protein [Qipengyuania atrilutea]|uniref:Glycosyltransferase family 4 protein n=1 Tax=Qipengyuania atrilutea TaxID=2744473 RepID=A0A850H3L2_9SPHN|nr:glycosyltransferase family 4 protein [Actirhodobacter atriluteus]NVD44792.1 glycosyltransferase family 4 protein [Actirhodobacter atriluteus]
MQVGVFHSGTQHSRLTALALQRQERLAWYATSIYPIRGFPARLVGKRYRQEGLDPALVRTGGWHEWAERAAAQAGFASLAQRLDAAGNRAFASNVLRWYRADAPIALWGYNGSSERAFTHPDTHSAPKILDRTVADWRMWNRCYDMIAKTHGDWLTSATPRAPQSLIDAEEREYAAADRIVCGSPEVATSLARESKLGGIAAKTRVLPYCFDSTAFDPSVPPPPATDNEPLKVLFVGQLSPRKGVQHLLEAAKLLPSNEVSVTLAGPLMIPRAIFARYADRVTYAGNVPRGGIPALMREHHVLVLPSYFEGSAITLLEALASGLAVIQTPQAGLGATEESGVVISRPDTQLLAEAIAGLSADRERVHAMRLAAQTEARRYSFANYRAGIASLLSEMGI